MMSQWWKKNLEMHLKLFYNKWNIIHFTILRNAKLSYWDDDKNTRLTMRRKKVIRIIKYTWEKSKCTLTLDDNTSGMEFSQKQTSDINNPPKKKNTKCSSPASVPTWSNTHSKAPSIFEKSRSILYDVVRCHNVALNESNKS